MECPQCKAPAKVSTTATLGEKVHRIRVCTVCHWRFVTTEVADPTIKSLYFDQQTTNEWVLK